MFSHLLFCSTPEANLGHHPDCGLSYILSHLPGRLGEYLGLTGAKLKVREDLLSINNGGEEDTIRSVIDEFSTNVQVDETSVLSKLSIIDDCFSRETVEEILDSLLKQAKEEMIGLCQCLEV
ncbi:hypothetical protein KY284_030631 [Solanum tuberosum]|nr:hypothetical protein KY284_030631 [Solanum tuberosum]